MSKIFLFLFFDKITRTSHHVAHAHEILFSWPCNADKEN
jgi:hypothetical protein